MTDADAATTEPTRDAAEAVAFDPDLRHRRLSDVRYRRVGEEGVVLRQEEAEVLVLDEVGVTILDLAARGETAGAIVEHLEAHYDASRPALERDVASFLAELRRSGCLETVPATADSSAGSNPGRDD